MLAPSYHSIANYLRCFRGLKLLDSTIHFDSILDSLSKNSNLKRKDTYEIVLSGFYLKVVGILGNNCIIFHQFCKNLNKNFFLNKLAIKEF